MISKHLEQCVDDENDDKLIVRKTEIHKKTFMQTSCLRDCAS